MGRTWGRLYAGTRHHRKLRILRQRCPESWWIFYPLLELAFETDDNGFIYVVPDIPFTIPELANEVGLTSDLLETTLQLMASLELISLEDGFVRFLSYSDRQFESDADAAERKRRSREKAKEKQIQCDGHNNVTTNNCDSHGDVTPPEQNRTETEQSKTESTLSRDDKPVEPAEAKVKKKPVATPPEHANGDFEKFWSAYPRKVGKPKATSTWQNLRKRGRLPPIEDILAAVEVQKQWEQWQEENGRFIPHPQTWLNREGWNDQQPANGGSGVEQWLKQVSQN